MTVWRNQCEKQYNSGKRHILTKPFLGDSSHNKLLCSSLNWVFSKLLNFIYIISEQEGYNRYMPKYTKTEMDLDH